MEKTPYEKLHNGSDIRGVAIEGIAGEIPNLTSTEATAIAKGFLLWLCSENGLSPENVTIAIGHDPRISGPKLKQALTDGLTIYGAEVLDAGLTSTPAMFMSTVFPEFACTGAIMITASHLPFNRNGFKFFDKNGGLNKGDITDILEYAEKDAISQSRLFMNAIMRNLGKSDLKAKKCNLMHAYCEHLKNIIKSGVNSPDDYNKPLSGMKIVVDAGNGSGGFYATQILKPLGADITGSRFLEPDGHFPNHAPNPEDKAAMASISEAVIANNADLGLIFDTDVDRSSAVDSKGREIARNGIVALAAALISDDHPNSTVVTDSITSNQLTDFLENTLGLKHLRFKRGYRNVINKAIELNQNGTDCRLAIETSGHAALKENYFLDDGAYLAAKIVIKSALLLKEGKTISTVIEDLKEPLEATEIRLPIISEDFGAIGDRILDDLKKYVTDASEMTLTEPNYEGVRITFNSKEASAANDFVKGWCLLRKSLHDPLLPLNIEADTKGGCRIIAKKLYDFLINYKELNLKPIEQFINTKI